MGLVYDSCIEAVSVSAAQDLFELLAPSDAAVLVHSLTVEQSNVDTGEQLRITCSRVTGAPTSGSGGGTITPTPRVSGGPAAGSTVERNNTTQLSGGTAVKVADRGFNTLAGLEIVFDPPIELAPSTRFLVAIPAPDTAIAVSATLTHEEIGG